MMVSDLKLPRYKLLDQLGSGGMGLVYKAEDLRLGRVVALKFLLESLTNPQALARFRREAQAASALNHPNICTIYDVDEDNGTPVISMELLEGHSLKHLIDNRLLKLDQAIDLAIQIANGLDAAHAKGIIHRDIKPANIFVLSTGVAKILDFGLAKMHGHNNREAKQAASIGPASPSLTTVLMDADLTSPGSTIGTIAYVSPEQAKGDELDTRTDLFSFGAVMYEMVVGQRSAPGSTTANIFDAILNRLPVKPRQVNPDISEDLERIIEKALEKDRDLRYQHASDIRTDLMRVKRGVPPSPLPPSTYWKRHRPAIAMAAAVLIVSLVAALVLPRAFQRGAEPVTEERLTFNSSDNPVTSFAISSDNKYLAYSDLAGIHIRLQSTGEEKLFPQPEEAPSNSTWEIASWFPDGDQVLTNLVSRSGDECSSWILPLLGKSARELRANTTSWEVSPDGSSIAFSPACSANGTKQIWLMDADGSNPQKFLSAGDHELVGFVHWSPDGHRIAYQRLQQKKPPVTSIESCDKSGADCRIAIASDGEHGFRDYCWMPSGRMVYARREAGDSDSGNFWQIAVRNESGAPASKPKRITQLAELNPWRLRTISNGSRLAYLRQAPQGLMEVGELTAEGTQLRQLRRLTNDESSGYPSDWTADSKVVLLTLSRGSVQKIFKQGLNQEAPEPVMTGSHSVDLPRLSPDGASILYVESSLMGADLLKRIPLSGGAPELVLKTSTWTNFVCGRSPLACIISEKSSDGKEIVMTAFDPVHGRGKVLKAIQTDRDAVGVHISNDALAYATVRRGEDHVQIHLTSFAGDIDRQIDVKGWSDIPNMDWSSSANHIYCGAVANGARALLVVDLTGQVQVLVQYRGTGLGHIWGDPSPDGRHIAIMGSSFASNVWTIGGF